MTKSRRILARRRAGRDRSTAATVATALAALAVLVGMAVLGVTAQRGLPWADTYDLTAEFVDAANIKRYAEVRIAGRRVGQVTDITSRDGTALIRLELERGAGPLRADTTARIRLKGTLGAKFVDLTPGRDGPALGERATIPSSQTSVAVDMFDVLESLDGRRRADLRAILDGLGQGFAGRGEELNSALDAAPSTLRDLAEVAETVNSREGAAERLVPSTEAAAAAFDPVREELALGFEPMARALAPFAERRADVQGALVEGPPALDAVRDGLAESDPLLRETAGLARELQRLTAPAPSALRRTTALMRQGREPLRSTPRLLRRITRSVPPTLQLTKRIDPLIAPIIRNLRAGTPALLESAARRCDTLALARNWRSMFAWGNPRDDELGPETGWRLEAVKNNIAGGAGPPRDFYKDTSVPCVLPEPQP
jgi:virulence factor Mce-like protein